MSEPEAVPLGLQVGPQRTRIPPHPEYDLLWFIANYAPELEQWERDIFLAVRAESLYFYPVFACQIMNEGWASYWHARLLREAEFLPQHTYLAAIKAHSDVVRPFASGEDRARHQSLPPRLHALGAHRRQARPRARSPGDEGRGRLRLHPQLPRPRARRKLDLFVYEVREGDEIRVANRDLEAVREAILAPSSTSARRAAAVEIKPDGGLVLAHEH